MPAIANKELEATRGDLGQGVYALSDLRVLLSVYGDPKDGKRAERWLKRVLNPVEHGRWQADYSFSDLVSLFVVRQLRERGVKPRKIRTAESYLRKLWRTDRPFAREDIKTDGVEVFCEDEVRKGQIDSASERGQQRIREAVTDGLASVFYDDGQAAYWVPMQGVLVDPRVQFGAPVVKGTRIPTEAAAGVVGNLGKEEAMLRFGLSSGRLEDAIAFEERIASLN
jgi:uncharacterized protein (DUF433 family)